jgi:cysteine-rich CPCC protein
VHRQPAILPDGRAIVAERDGDGGWTLTLGDAVTRGRDLRRLLAAAIGGHPGWIGHVHEELAGRDAPGGRRWPCACCGCFTLSAPGRATYEICPVCCWEDDGVQFDDPGLAGGANAVSLRQARRSYQTDGVADPAHAASVRPPLPEEEP